MGKGNTLALGRVTTKGKFFIGVLLIVCAVGYLMYTGIRETSTYYLTIEEFLLQKEAMANEGIRVAGRVQKGSIDWNPKDLNLTFKMVAFKEKEGEEGKTATPVATPQQNQQDGHAEQLEGLAIHYQGIVPDMFAEDRDVIVEGEYIPSPNGNVLEATAVMTTCPSKYEAEIEGQETAASAY
jgi:cytochrome c-type biogenesis protein CcmE